jgi:hypothetical protein
LWNRPAHRLALLELWARGTLRRRESQASAWDELVRLGWMRLGGRRGEGELAERGRVEATLDACWPDWREVMARLEAEGLSTDERGWKELRRRERAEGIDSEALAERMNVRTATALVAEHSKATLSAAHLESLRRPEIVHDGVVRMRVPPGLSLVRGELAVSCDELAGLTHEVVLTERSLLDGTRLAGTIRAVLSVENRGSYLDLSPPPGWLVVHAPGWDVGTVLLLMAGLERVPWIHFGDLDPQGVSIYRYLTEARKDAGWLVPSFWDLARGLRRAWPEGLVGDDDPPLVRRLARDGLWLEQEAVALDPRLGEALEGWLSGEGGSTPGRVL